ncbi:methyltransferase domain-containing protein [bacterium]|nr:methyltransferase domain-containing protein [bacterium]
MIRWVSSEVRIFAYFKNMVLIACFLGFGTGCLLYRRPAQLLQTLLLLLIVSLVIQLPWQPLLDYGPRRISLILADLPGLMIFKLDETFLSWSGFVGLCFAIGWATLLFLVLAMIMVPFGQIVASSMAEMSERSLTAYSINVAGSLAGILTYTLMTMLELPPICWFVPAAMLFLYLPHAPSARKETLAVIFALTLTHLPNNNFQETVFWSPYQKIALIKGEDVLVNNLRHQWMSRQPSLIKEKNPSIKVTLIPYLMHQPPGRVLVLGSGTGNDVAAALGAGAESVTAVEIDPVIVDIGTALHPQKPYDDPRVRVVLDDARHFLRTTTESFDLIVFGVLDSHTALSSFTNVRLDDYIYTVESLEDARKRLRPGGMLNIAFWIERPYIAARLSRNLTQAFDHEPVALFGLVEQESGWRIAIFCTAENESMPLIESRTKLFPTMQRFSVKGNPVVPSTDNWPFLPLSEPHIPILVLILSIIIFALCSLFIWKARPPGEPFRGRVFWLGAAFMLLEVHNVSRLALCFGTTWQVNAWVIGMILSVILLANFLRMRFGRPGAQTPKWVAIGLFGSLAAAYLVPLQSFLDYSYIVGGFLATLLLTLPIFFAAILFADALASSSSPGFALGWNILGAVLGGMIESVSFLFGIPSLIIVSAGFYSLAIFWPERRNPNAHLSREPLKTVV